MSITATEEKAALGEYTRDAALLRNRAAMVLFTLEQCLGAYVRENAADTTDLPNDQVSKHTSDNGSLLSVAEIIQGTYISEILDLAISVARFNSDKSHLANLKTLADTLKLYDIRNAVCHPNRPFPECFWHRLSALVTDPAIEFLQFQDVHQAFLAAIQNKITLPSDEWFSASGFELRNNLPDTFEHDITGFIGRAKERSDLVKRLKNQKLNMLALVGPGGTGKTALALDVLHELVLDPSNSDWVDEVIYVSAKTERLTNNGPVPIESPLDSLDAVKEAIAGYLADEHDYDCHDYEEIIDKLGQWRLLLCVDNLETLLRDHGEAFDDFYSDIPASWRVLVTSRVPINSATVITLDPMQAQAAALLARQYLTRRGGVPLSSEVLSRIASRADSNPLAIRVCIDSYLVGVELDNALSQARSSLLDFSYTNLLKVLPSESHHVLECLFAAGERLPRAELCTLLDVDIDNVATGLNALLRTSLIVRHTEEAEESYSLSSSVHELLLRNPIDEQTRKHVVVRMAERRSAIAAIKSDPSSSDPLDAHYINDDASESAKHKAYDAFRAIRRGSPKVVLADLLNSVRQSLASTPSESLLYRTASCLYLELNDLASGEQILVEAAKREALDASGRLLLAESRKVARAFDECKAFSDMLIRDGWLSDGRTSRRNLVRLAHVSWLVRVWLGESLIIAAETKNWEAADDLRATMGCIHVTAMRRLIEKKCDRHQLNSYCQEMIRCLGILLSSEGYLGFLVKEAFDCLKQILFYQDADNLDEKTRQLLTEFFRQHFTQICSVHREIKLGDPLSNRLLDSVRVLVGNSTDSLLVDSRLEPLEDDERLAEVGYVSAEIFYWPEDNFGNRRSFCFARGTDDTEYYVSRRSIQEGTAFYELNVGDRLSVRPKSDYDEGRAIPVAHAMPF